jgi:HEAT repeat protein
MRVLTRRRDDPERLILELGHAKARRRVRAAMLLGLKREKRAETALLSALSDKDSWVRFQAARALVQIDAARPAEPLLERLGAAEGRSSDYKTPVDDAEELLRLGIGELRSLPLLDSYLNSLQSPMPSVRAMSVEMLGRLSDSRASDALIRASTDANRRVRTTAIRALGGLGDERSAAYLSQLAREGRLGERLLARRALKRIRTSLPTTQGNNDGRD